MSPQDQDAKRIEASVIVVTHNNESLIADCLRSIDGAVRVNAYETIVVDNASTDGTISAIPHDTSTRVIPLDANVGFAAAANAGIEASRGSLIVLVNSDAFPDPGSIDGLIDAIKELPTAGIVGGRLRYPDGRLQPSVGRFPSLPGSLWVALFLHRLPLAGRFGIGISAHPALYRSRRSVDWVTAAFCVARREVAALPSHWFMYGEDVAWALASRHAGFEVWFDPRASAVHIGRASVDQSQGSGFAQRRRVQFELDWFGRRGRICQIGARAVIAVHAVVRLAIFGLGGAVRGRRDGKVSENVALLRAAFSTRREDGSDADRIAAKSDPLGC